MDKPRDPATPFAEVYQSFLDDLVLHGRKPSTIDRYRYNIVRFEKWLVDNGVPATSASFEQRFLVGDRGPDRRRPRAQLPLIRHVTGPREPCDPGRRWPLPAGLRCRCPPRRPPAPR